ncbi:MAG: MFS transporter [Methanomassiliicoccales archaeon]|nr:MFS transporter [Methanomassiliicoccales archaeon]
MHIRKRVEGGRKSVGASDSDALRYAIYFIVLLGTVSLFADMAYEGARSISGSYLRTLGASSAVVGLVSGFGELIGYCWRVVSGHVTDRTGRYWAIMMIGYGMNLLAIPMLALAGDWFSVALLIMMERMGKAVRAPARDAMISHAAIKTGRGWAFGVQEALSSVGAMLGPVLMFLVFLCGGTYSTGFLLMSVPAALTLIVLYVTFRRYPHPQAMEAASPAVKQVLPRRFWWYAIAAAFLAAGYVDFPLVAYHMEVMSLGTSTLTPLLYALAMGVDAISAMLLGKVFDRHGPKVLLGVIVPAAFFPLFAFTSSISLIALGMVLFGLGMGAQESIMRAMVADLAPVGRRATAYGYYNTIFGSFWFIGSLVLGTMYDLSLSTMVTIAIGLQLTSLPLFLMFLSDRRK